MRIFLTGAVVFMALAALGTQAAHASCIDYSTVGMNEECYSKHNPPPMPSFPTAPSSPKVLKDVQENRNNLPAYQNHKKSYRGSRSHLYMKRQPPPKEIAPNPKNPK